MKVVWTEAAVYDLESIVDHIRRDSPDAAAVYDGDLHLEVQQADEEFERGEFLPHEEVVALFATRFAKA